MRRRDIRGHLFLIILHEASRLRDIRGAFRGTIRGTFRGAFRVTFRAAIRSAIRFAFRCRGLDYDVSLIMSSGGCIQKTSGDRPSPPLGTTITHHQRQQTTATDV